jgi:predicted dehydrogenase
MKKIRWGIIGCGDVTEVKSGPAFQKVTGSVLHAVMRRDAEKAADYARRHKVPKWYDNADALINDPEVDAVYVATPPDTHAFYAKKVIEAGKPVYIEKPMAVSYAECLEVNELAARKNVPVFVAYYRRRLPGFVKVKEWVEQGAIGEVRMVQLQLFKHPQEQKSTLPWRVNPQIAGGGHFYDLAAHQFDFLFYLFGPVKEVVSVVENQGGIYLAEDVLSVAWLYENGVVGNGSWCFNAAAVNDRDQVEIIGTRGRIVFSTFDFIPIELITENGKEIFHAPKPAHVQQDMIAEIVAVLHGQAQPVSTGVSGAETNRIMEQIVSAYYQKNK